MYPFKGCCFHEVANEFMETSSPMPVEPGVLCFKQANPNTDEGGGVVQGLFTLIGMVALVFFFSMMESMDDILEYGWGLLAVFGMLFSILYGMFKKKATVTEAKVFVKEEGIWMAGIDLILYENLHLDCYYAEGAFCRYHLYDTTGLLAIYSVKEDEFYKELLRQGKAKIKKREERQVRKDDATVHCSFAEGKLIYELDSGAYTFEGLAEESKKVLPKTFAIDPQYKPFQLTNPLRSHLTKA